ncbi:hypothetical protein [Virgibacillus ihumii]|uniref:hypothetical protein n=1 Tax=Virgibacillus ihumii TaxID=2686091 RepID=UPI00157BC707|nr:hypothetical protein [Virgibacillus ihumii]
MRCSRYGVITHQQFLEKKWKIINGSLKMKYLQQNPLTGQPITLEVKADFRILLEFTFFGILMVK